MVTMNLDVTERDKQVKVYRAINLQDGLQTTKERFYPGGNKRKYSPYKLESLESFSGSESRERNVGAGKGKKKPAKLKFMMNGERLSMYQRPKMRKFN